jgi:type II secretory pathway predicted ATPase ExeA
MYCEHFGLKWRPFDGRHESEFYIADPGVSKVLLRLGAALSAQGSMVAITGGPGVGKSALIDEALRPAIDRFVIVRADLRYADPEELFALVLADVGISAPTQDADCLRQLREFTRQAHEADQQLLVCLDAPIFTSAMAKKILRLALAGGYDGYPLNIVLQGPHRMQPMLDVAGLVQLRQRLLFRHRVEALNTQQTREYICHRLQQAGGDAAKVLQEGVCQRIHAYAAGIPRHINALADASISEAFVQDASQVTVPMLDSVARALGCKALATSAKDQASPAAPRPGKTPPVKPAGASSSPAVKPAKEDTASKATADKPRAPAAVNCREKPDESSADDKPDSALRLEDEAPPSRKPDTAAKGDIGGDDKAASGSHAAFAGKLRLEDLDDRLAETFFTNDPELVKQFRNMVDEASADGEETKR